MHFLRILHPLFRRRTMAILTQDFMSRRQHIWIVWLFFYREESLGNREGRPSCRSWFIIGHSINLFLCFQPYGHRVYEAHM